LAPPSARVEIGTGRNCGPGRRAASERALINAVTLQPSVLVGLRNLTSWTIVRVRSENQLLTRKASEHADHFIDYGGHANVKRAGSRQWPALVFGVPNVGNNGSISPGFRGLGEHGLARQSTL
jgi:hypothetical protein